MTNDSKEPFTIQAGKRFGAKDVAMFVRYFPKEGNFVWLDRPNSHFKRNRDATVWRNKYVGMPAFITDNGRGYRVANISGQRIYAHRAAFACMTGEWPKMEVDHINGNPADNRWENLRDVSARVNCQNKPAPKRRNSSGFLGICRTNKPSCWVPQISIGNKSINLGATPCLGVAIARRKDAERKYGFHQNHGRTQAND